MITISEVGFCYFLFIMPYYLVCLIIFDWTLVGAPEHLYVRISWQPKMTETPSSENLLLFCLGLKGFRSLISDGHKLHLWLEVFVDSAVMWIWAVIPCMGQPGDETSLSHFLRLFPSCDFWVKASITTRLLEVKAVTGLLLVHFCPSLMWPGSPIGLLTFGFQNESLILQLNVLQNAFFA